MTDSQKVAASVFSLTFVGAASLLLTVVASLAVLGVLRGNTLLGENYLALVFGTENLKRVMIPVGTTLTAGLAIGASLGAQKVYTYTAASLLGLGIVASLTLLLVGSNYELGAEIVDDWSRDVLPEAFSNATTSFVTWTIASFSAGLVALLGIGRLQGVGE
jgi:hypothetical protein